MSGEIGHIPIPGNDRHCGCGGRGCLETLASQRGMIQSLRESMSDPPRYPLTFADVVKAADRKLPVWMRDTFDAIATGVSAALNMYGVRRAVLVGRVTELPALATDYLIDVIQRAACGVVSRRCRSRWRPSGSPAAWSSPAFTAS